MRHIKFVNRGSITGAGILNNSVYFVPPPVSMHSHIPVHQASSIYWTGNSGIKVRIKPSVQEIKNRLGFNSGDPGVVFDLRGWTRIRIPFPGLS